jgi:CheY-like chemotaxis protein
VGSRILIVEDNAANLCLVRDILEFRGHEVDVATDVEQARQRLSLQRPELVVLDIQLPGGGGELLLRQIRAEAAWADLPVIAVTAFAMDGDRERLLASGFDGYISKPIATRSFGPTVESFLRKRPSPPET